MSNTSTDTNEEYIYIIHRKEFIDTNQSIYKIGRTSQENPFDRLSDYPKGSKIIMVKQVCKSKMIENEIVKQLSKSFYREKKYGREYFNGNALEIRKIVDNIIDSYELNELRSTNDRTNIILKENENMLKNYKKLTNIDDIKINNMVSYIRLDRQDNKVYRGGKVIEIEKNQDGNHRIKIQSNLKNQWYISLDKCIIFYKTKSSEESRLEEREKWKENMKKNNPEEYKKWLKEKEEKEVIRKTNPELYKKKYQHYRVGKTVKLVK